MNISPIDIPDRQKDYEKINAIVQWLELGMRAISIMYDDHSSDKNSKENIFRLKDNIYYRLSSARHMYKLLLQELFKAEDFLGEQERNKNDLKIYYGPNPYMEIIERDVSAVFDSVVFNIVSIFDYLSHIICYICKSQKQETFYWTRLAKAVRNSQTELGKSNVSKTVDVIDKTFVGRLYDYRSSLIHNKREKHNYSLSHSLKAQEFKIQILLTNVEMKDFKLIYTNNDQDAKFTLTYLASWLITTSAGFIEQILDSLEKDIKCNSSYYHNIRGAKGDKHLIFMSVDPITNIGVPTSETFWHQFKDTSPLLKNANA